jgi:hypothetical protein
MRRLLMLLVICGLGSLGIYSLAPSTGKEPPLQEGPRAGKGETGQARSKPKRQGGDPGFQLPHTSTWERRRTRGGIYSYRVPPGWFTRDMPDSRDRARIHTGFLLCPSQANRRTAFIWYPCLPIHSPSSTPVKRLLDSFKPKKVGLILYKLTHTKRLFRSLRWPFLLPTGPRQVAATLNQEWYGKLAFTKWGSALPYGFSLTGAKRLTANLAATLVRYRVGDGDDPAAYTPLEGLCYLGTVGRAQGSGDWGVWMLLIQTPQGEWSRHLPTLWAILRSLEYDQERHLETIGPARGVEVAQQRDAVKRLRLENLEARFAQVKERSRKN